VAPHVEQHVLGLQVAEQDALAVQVLEAQHNLRGGGRA
jgi:hypothetical protein